MNLDYFWKLLYAETGKRWIPCLLLYMPLINRLSSYAGNLDEDCRQYIMLHIVLHISEFRI